MKEIEILLEKANECILCAKYTEAINILDEAINMEINNLYSYKQELSNQMKQVDFDYLGTEDLTYHFEDNVDLLKNIREDYEKMRQEREFIEKPKKEEPQKIEQRRVIEKLQEAKPQDVQKNYFEQYSEDLQEFNQKYFGNNTLEFQTKLFNTLSQYVCLITTTTKNLGYNITIKGYVSFRGNNITAEKLLEIFNKCEGIKFKKIDIKEYKSDFYCSKEHLKKIMSNILNDIIIKLIKEHGYLLESDKVYDEKLQYLCDIISLYVARLLYGQKINDELVNKIIKSFENDLDLKQVIDFYDLVQNKFKLTPIKE